MERPHLRVVNPEERAKPSASPVEPLATEPSSSPGALSTKEFLALQERVKETDATVPLCAAYLVCDGCYLADAAVSLHNAAVAHAPASTYRQNVPPGLRSAEAVRVWLDTHLNDIKKMIADDTQTSYARGKELKQAVDLAATELQRAHVAAKAVGLYLDDRYAGILRNVTEDLVAVSAARKPVSVVVVEEEEEEEDTYVLGAYVLGSMQ